MNFGIFYREAEVKETAIGEVPKEWEVVRLSDIVTKFMGGGTPSTSNSEYWDGDIPWMTSANLIGRTVLHGMRNITKKGLESSATNLVPKGSLLVSTRVGIGKVGIAGINIAISQDLTGVVVDSHRANAEYLYWSLLKLQYHLKGLAQGSTIKGLLREYLGDLQIPLPALAEQRKITEILSTVDEAIQKTNEIISNIERLKKGLMQQLLTKGIGHKEFKYSEEIGADIPKEWKVVSLGDVTNIRYGLGQPPESDEDGVPMIRATNIKRGAIVETSLFRVKRSAIPKSRSPFLRAGDVIVVRSGAYTGDIGLVTEKWEGAVAGYDLVLSPTKRMINSVYLANYLLGSRVQTYFLQLRVRAAQPHLNSGQVCRVFIPLPSLAEQEKIATTLSTINKKLEIERNEQANLETIKQGLMDLLLTGKIRIKVD